MAVIGIDLGTTNSLVTTYRDGEVVIITDINGEKMIPSAVATGEQGEILIGNAAREYKILHPNDCALEFKRQMGSDEKVTLGNTTYLPEELSAFILKKCKEEAETFLGEPVTEAIISVPAYFDNNKRAATKLAAEIAEISCQRILNEPSAAALAYRIESGNRNEQYIMVIDFGGGTLDISLVDCFENIVEIVGVSGNNKLGGKDFDEKITQAFLDENHLQKEELSESDMALIRRMAEESKILLSERECAVMRCKINDRVYTMELNEAKLMSICGNLLLQMKECMVKVVKDANCEIEEITDVVLVGGTCQMPIVKKYISELFGHACECREDMQELVAKGIGYYIGIKERASEMEALLMSDVCPFTLGVGVRNEYDLELVMSPIISKNTTLPRSQCERYITRGDFQEKIQFSIYQGENYHVKDNLKLGELEIAVPPDLAGREYVDVTMSYDLNGIICVEAKNRVGKQVEYFIKGMKNNLSKAQLKEYAQKMKQKSYLPRELEECSALLELSMRLYEQASEEGKEILDSYIRVFTYAKEYAGQIEGVKIIREYKEKLSYYINEMQQDPFAKGKEEE